jgi:hypothetical protein
MFQSYIPRDWEVFYLVLCVASSGLSSLGRCLLFAKGLVLRRRIAEATRLKD